MKAFFLTEGTRTSPASRIRVYNHLDRLAGESDLRAEALSYTSEGYCRLLMAGEKAGLIRKIGEAVYKRRVYTRLAVGAQRSDLVFLQRVLPSEHWLTGLKRTNPCLVYDFDDAVYLAGPEREMRFRAMMRASSRIIAVSESAAREAIRRGAGESRVSVIPSPVDCIAYRQRKPGGEANSFTVGWIGSPATTSYLRAVWPELAVFAAGCPAARFLFIGARPFDTGEFAGRVRFEPWSGQAEKDLSAGMDAGLMPLPDDPWCRGKGAYKLIQYMAAAVPCLAAPVGANLEVVAEGVTGFFARKSGEWRALLDRLAADSALCNCLGAAGRKRAENLYDYSVTTDKFHQVLTLAHLGPSRVAPAEHRE